MFFVRKAQSFGDFWRHFSQYGELDPNNGPPDLMQLQARKEIGLASWTPTHRHKKGGTYRKLGDGILESEPPPVCRRLIYLSYAAMSDLSRAA